jgi:Cu2+-exporting ATPase
VERPEEEKSQAAEVSCDHCGLPVPRSLIEPGAETQFCCEGCRLVYSVIHEHGLDRYYDLLRDTERVAQAAKTSGKGFDEFDDPTFHELYVRDAGNGLKTVELYLEGVHCAACVWLVEKVPLVVPGVAETTLEIRRSMARVTWDPETTPLSRVARFLDSLGYAPHPFRGVEVRQMRRREDRSLLIRITVAGACAGNVMMLAVALYGGMFHGMAAQYESFFRWTSLVISLPAVLWSAGVFYKGAWGSLKTRALHMDVPITLGIGAGFFWGAWNTIRGTGEIYFDSVTALIFLLLVGRYVQQRRQRSAADAAELLFSLAPSSARVLEDGDERTVPLEALVPGMTVQVKAGESVPVDGTVLDGQSSLDGSLLTGESRPVPVTTGDPAHAGTVNLTSPLSIRVRAAGENTRVGRLMRMVEEASQRRAPVVRMADRISAWFVSAVLALAALTLVIWWGIDPARAVDHAIALLIVTCPCALGLATPLAVSAAIGRAGRSGILIKGGDALERLARPGRVLLDKTGTVTEGRTALVRWEGDEAAKPLVLAVESRVAHPVARAFVEALGGEEPLPATELVRSSAGVEATVDGHRVSVGSTRFAGDRVGMTESWSARADEIAGEGLTPIVIAVDGEIRAVAGIGDPLREDAAATVKTLRRDGWDVALLSGDHPRVVAAVGRRMDLGPGEVEGGATPEMKLRVVERAAGEGPVVMVGDGVNDAAALSAATVGVAVHGGAEVALAVADVFLTREGIEPLVRLVRGARRTIRVIRRNLIFSLIYNLIGASLALAGWIGPLVAAVLMPLSSLTVITYSFRARTF